MGNKKEHLEGYGMNSPGVDSNGPGSVNNFPDAAWC